MTRSYIRTPYVIGAAAGFLLGVGAASCVYATTEEPPWWMMNALVFFAGAAVTTLLRRHRSIVAVVTIATILGVVRFAGSTGSIGTDLESNVQHTIVGRVVERSDVSGGRVRVELASVRMGEGMEQSLTQPIQLFMDRTHGSGLRYGDVVRARCMVLAPEKKRERLMSAGSCIVHTASDVTVFGRGAGSWIIGALRSTRVAMSDRVDRALRDPAAGMVRALVLGDRGALSTELLERFRRTGASHVLVVSGWHMGVVVFAMQWLLRTVGLHRRSRMLVTIVAVMTFLAMIGFSPSAVRGAAMAGTLLLVGIFGRVGNPVRALLLVATAMVAMHPSILGFDVAFQLSFAATIVILFAAARVRTMSRKRLRGIASVLVVSCAAAIATAPITAGAFGRIALVGPIVNAFVVFFVPLLMGFGALLIGATFVLPIAVPMIAWVLHALAGTLVHSVTIIATLPWAQVLTPSVDWWFIVGMELMVLAWCVVFLRRRGESLFSPFGSTAQLVHSIDDPSSA